MATKCVHKGCGKAFTDSDEPCSYHPGPPVFHEGQKGCRLWPRNHVLTVTGWKCCKPRVLTFDEFMNIPPCTTGKHSTVDDTPTPEPQPSNEDIEAKIKAQKENQDSLPPAIARNPVAAQPARPTPSPAPPDVEEDDDPDLPVPEGAACKRKACGASYKAGQSREGEDCVHHPGRALFHEGSKGWTCCKRRVLEFDEFMKIPGCTTKKRHLFVGAKKDPNAEELVNEVRNDFYQTASTVIASLYLKKIEKDRSRVVFADDRTVELDLHTSDHKQYKTNLSTFGTIVPDKSSFKIMGTKLELTLAKADGVGWPVLRADDPHTGEIIQAGRASRV
ncbi:hypothetical protein BAUCODRAFT_61337 [Baudoinia panamericana UAMH 10762]|uniref:CS domain-containing protein n=1 Tax=Baudoinia panamericana (strain UAMH 10762) TaxID=717646 RepID=M2M0Z4_BAUPA|nr:uncharacterized protein BAUCODRAFT_61337 [Baudoinia panamericana UAMH 10762]EMD00698.1 hypothetical protein BAUCODRAFT_61337 [Baudoinia panamericana UAMH 10762]